MKTISIPSLLYTAILLFTLIGCTPSREITIEKGLVPPDFPGYKGTLLILKSEDHWNPITLTRKLRIAFEKNYTGKYEFIERGWLEDAYQDTNEYRFMIEIYSFISKYNDVGKVKITDRKTKEAYECDWDIFYFKLPKLYAMALESYQKKGK